MQIYLVGGAVRDQLLGLTVHDRDWVVVGTDAETLLKLGYRSVGKDFPVFLHPKTHEEYALARTERKIAKGYTGFQFNANKSVTLEEDLMRRDLTINAMAQDLSGQLIDPYGGKQDLDNKILRHVSPAFVEDPVRILRVARFAARYDFQVAPETLSLMQEMVKQGEVAHLVPERVWQEIAKGLMEPHPQKMMTILRQSGALKVLLPEIDALFGVPQRADYHPEIDCGLHTLMTVQRAADLQLSLPERYAALLHDLGKALTPADVLPKHIGHDLAGKVPIESVNQRLRVPKECAQLAHLVARFHIRLHQVQKIKHAKKILKLLQEMDAFRRSARFECALNVCQADKQGRLGHEHSPYPQREIWLKLLVAAKSVDTRAIAQQYSGCQEDIIQAIHQARCQAISRVLSSLS